MHIIEFINQLSSFMAQPLGTWQDVLMFGNIFFPTVIVFCCVSAIIVLNTNTKMDKIKEK